MYIYIAPGQKLEDHNAGDLRVIQKELYNFESLYTFI
jgi:hypothetical protein